MYIIRWKPCCRLEEEHMLCYMVEENNKRKNKTKQHLQCLVSKIIKTPCIKDGNDRCFKRKKGINAKLRLHNKINALTELRKYFFMKSDQFLHHPWVTTSTKQMKPTYHYWIFFADSTDNDVDINILVENSVQHGLCHKLIVTIVIISDLLTD